MNKLTNWTATYLGDVRAIIYDAPRLRVAERCILSICMCLIFLSLMVYSGISGNFTGNYTVRTYTTDFSNGLPQDYACPCSVVDIPYYNINISISAFNNPTLCNISSILNICVEYDNIMQGTAFVSPILLSFNVTKSIIYNYVQSIILNYLFNSLRSLETLSVVVDASISISLSNNSTSKSIFPLADMLESVNNEKKYVRNLLQLWREEGSIIMYDWGLYKSICNPKYCDVVHNTTTFRSVHLILIAIGGFWGALIGIASVLWYVVCIFHGWDTSNYNSTYLP